MKSNFTLADLKNTACARLNGHLLNSSGNLSSSKKKRSKYNNQKIEFDGHVFDSQKECNRYINLRALQTAGEIKDLQCQVEYILETCSYIADFVYMDCKTRLVVVEDVKSPATKKLRVYRLKKAMMLSQYKIEIKEV
jgi:hypothetical protein